MGRWIRQGDRWEVNGSLDKAGRPVGVNGPLDTAGRPEGCEWAAG